MQIIIGFLKNVGILLLSVSLFFVVRYVYLWIKSLFRPLSIEDKQKQVDINFKLSEEKNKNSLNPMFMPKTYNLKTIKEIEDIITKDNIECFKTDFCSWLDILIGMKEINKTSSEFFIEISDTFKWIDDGKNDKTLTIEIK